ncbi:MAG: hypothetical protein JWM40_847 [Frankiales bacterium]|nr:hypothetical protein [Frankiales bacterium]
MRRLTAILLLLSLSACGYGSPKASGPTATPPSSPTAAAPTLPPCPHGGEGLCLGPLAAGTYTTQYFQPAITYTVPRGWDSEEDQPGNFLLIPPGGDLPGVDEGTSDFLGIYSSVAAPDGCKDAPAPGVGMTAAAVSDWLTRDPSLVVTAKHPVTVGGLTGVVMDLAVSARAKPCPYSNGKPIAPYLIGVGSSRLEHNTGPGQKTRMYVLNHAGAALAIEVVDVHGGRDLDVHAAITQQLSFSG